VGQETLVTADSIRQGGLLKFIVTRAATTKKDTNITRVKKNTTTTKTTTNNNNNNTLHYCYHSYNNSFLLKLQSQYATHNYKEK
jgi:hypothetical protein